MLHITTWVLVRNKILQAHDLPRRKRVRSLITQSQGSIQDLIFGVILVKHRCLQKGHQNWGRPIPQIASYSKCSCKYVQWNCSKSTQQQVQDECLVRWVWHEKRRTETQPYQMLPHRNSSTTNSISSRYELNTWIRTSIYFSIACWIQGTLTVRLRKALCVVVIQSELISHQMNCCLTKRLPVAMCTYFPCLVPQ